MLDAGLEKKLIITFNNSTIQHKYGYLSRSDEKI